MPVLEKEIDILKRNHLKSMVDQLTEKQKSLFIKCFGPVVCEEKLDSAIQLCERTLK